MPREIIVTRAVTGSVYTPSMNVALPVTPDEVADQAIAAAHAGAAMRYIR